MAESVGQKLIAEKAGVSRTTVSVVLNNRPTPVISEKTRKRVLQVAKSMGYRPRPKITFPTGTHNLGVFLPRGAASLFLNGFYAGLFEGIQQEAAQHNFHLIFAMPDNKIGRQGPALLSQNKCDGVLVVGSIRERLMKALAEDQTPVVVVGEAPAGFESVVADNAQAARLAVQHLVAKGHRQIVYLGRDREAVTAAERYDAFRLAMLDHDLDLQRDLMLTVSGDAEGGAGAADELAERLDEVTAVLCCNDATALGFSDQLAVLGKKVPEDVSLIGMDDVPEASRANLTTIAVPKEDMGQLAVKKLLAKIAGEDTPANRSVVPVELVERGSVAEVG